MDKYSLPNFEERKDFEKIKSICSQTAFSLLNIYSAIGTLNTDNQATPIKMFITDEVELEDKLIKGRPVVARLRTAPINVLPNDINVTSCETFIICSYVVVVVEYGVLPFSAVNNMSKDEDYIWQPATAIIQNVDRIDEVTICDSESGVELGLSETVDLLFLLNYIQNKFQEINHENHVIDLYNSCIVGHKLTELPDFKQTSDNSCNSNSCAVCGHSSVICLNYNTHLN